MKVYELIQKLCENAPTAEVDIRVIGDNERFQEYLDDTLNAGMSASEIWATIYRVSFDKYKNIVFVDCDLSRL